MHDRFTHAVKRWGMLVAIGAALALGAVSCKRDTGETSKTPGEVFTHSEEGVDLKMVVRRTEVGLGELVELVFEIEHFSDIEVAIAQSDDWRGDFEVYAIDTAPGRVTDGGRRIMRSIVYSLEPLHVGDLAVDNIPIDYWPSDQPLRRKRFEMASFSVDVFSLVAGMVGENTNAADIMDIEGPWIPEARKQNWTPAAVVAFVCGGALLWFLRRGNLKVPKTDEAERSPVAGEMALHELSTLLGERLCEQGLPDPFFVRLSDLMRRYIESRFGCPVVSQTTQEFLTAALRGEILDQGQLKMLDGVLTQSDLVKFAGVAVSPEAARISAEDCKRFVSNTMEDPR